MTSMSRGIIFGSKEVRGGPNNQPIRSEQVLIGDLGLDGVNNDMIEHTGLLILLFTRSNANCGMVVYKKKADSKQKKRAKI